MASKDFMAPKTPAPAPAPQSHDCGPKKYGVSPRPADGREAGAILSSVYASGRAAQTNQSNAETARLQGQLPTPTNQSNAETARLQNQPKPSINRNSVNMGGTTASAAPQAATQATNAYAHNTSNTVASSKGSSDFEKINLNAQFQPNILDNFDVITYHYKLFITDPAASSTGQVLNVNDQVIIAESGVTDLTIDNVEVRSITTPSVEGGTGVSTLVNFDITEPSGAGLIDKLFYQSVALGIGNWAVMPVYLQLQFRGRDPETSAPEEGAPGSLSSLKWLWTLKISEIKANVTHVGTKYEFKAIVYNDFAQSNAIFTLQHNVVLNDLDKFSDAMNELQNKLNSDQLLKLINNYSIPDSYKIVVDPKIANYKITPANSSTNPQRSDNYATYGNKDATFTSGTSIDKIIDSLLAQTSEYQKSMLGAPAPGAEGLPMNEVPSQMKKFWRIITETRPLKFDPRRQDISKEFTIFIVEYDIGIMDSNVFQTSAPPITIEAQRKRLLTYVEKAILKKRYNYIFTGLNDQIISFDLTVNNAFANSQSRFGGIYSNVSMSDKGPVNHEHAKDEAGVTAALSRAISFQNSSRTANSTEGKTAFEDAKKSINSANLPEETKNRYRILLENSKPESRLAFQSDVQRAGGIANNGTLESARTEATYLSRPITDKASQQQLRFISDVNIASSNTQNAYTNYMENSRGKLRPIARVESLQDRQVGLGVEANSNSGIQKLSTMFSVALHSGLDSSFQKIKLVIKGDPYWLSPQPYRNDNERIFNSVKGDQAAIDWIKNAHTMAVDSANLYGTDNFILLRFRSPKIYNNFEEDSNPNDSSVDIETFSGVYKVTALTSRFNMGKFEQELECILDPEINILNITDQIEALSRQKDTRGTTGDLIENPIPATSVRTDRIMASLPAPGLPSVSQALASSRTKGPQLASNIPTASNTFTGLSDITGA